jgi:hypothetical protein
LQTTTTAFQGEVNTINRKIQTIETELNKKEPLLTVEGDGTVSNGFKVITNDSSGNPVIVRSLLPGDYIDIKVDSNDTALTFSAPVINSVVNDLNTAEQNINQLQTTTTTLQGEIDTINNEIQNYQNTLNLVQAFTLTLSNQVKYNIEVMGGGVVNHTINYVSGVYYSALNWSSSVVVKTVPLNGTEPNGQFFIDCPAPGTAITVYGNSGGSYTEQYTNGFEMISNMRNLYYIWKGGNGEASNPASFRLVDYNASNVPMDPTWILIASTTGRPAQYNNNLKWVPGDIVFPGEFVFGTITYTYDTATASASWLGGGGSYQPLLTVNGDDTNANGYKLITNGNNVRSIIPGNNITITPIHDNDITINATSEITTKPYVGFRLNADGTYYPFGQVLPAITIDNAKPYVFGVIFPAHPNVGYGVNALPMNLNLTDSFANTCCYQIYDETKFYVRLRYDPANPPTGEIMCVSTVP